MVNTWRRVARITTTTCRCYSTTPRPFKFHVGVSFLGKPQQRDDKYTQGQVFPAGPIKEWRDHALAWDKGLLSTSAGHDFYFVQETQKQSGLAFGVADGVGGWSENGIDPSMFSQALMYHAHQYCKTSWAGEPETDPTLPEDYPVEGRELSPQECLDYAYGGVLREKSVVCGSSTACILSLNASSGLLRAANLGDSGFLLIRSANLFYHQRPQTHGFNFPRQLSKFPNTKRRDEYFVDQPGDADNYSTQLRGGDIIIAFTDGLTDNVFPAEAVQLSSLVMRMENPPLEQAQILADRLILMANLAMWDTKRISPFGLGMKRRGHAWDGGKVDDVLVVVVLVTED